MVFMYIHICNSRHPNTAPIRSLERAKTEDKKSQTRNCLFPSISLIISLHSRCSVFVSSYEEEEERVRSLNALSLLQKFITPFLSVHVFIKQQRLSLCLFRVFSNPRSFCFWFILYTCRFICFLWYLSKFKILFKVSGWF